MKWIKRWLTISAGTCVVAVGLILMPIPGPGGTPVTLAGLAILAAELPMARRLKDRFLAFRSRHFQGMHPWKRFAIVAGVLAGYAVMTTATWWVWAASRS